MKKLDDHKNDLKFGSSEFSVDCDKFDKENFQEIKSCSSKLLKQEEAGKKEIETYGPLMQDLFSTLYKMEPKLRPEHEMRLDHLFNYEIEKQVMEHRRTKEIRAMSTMDPMMSAIGVEDLSEAVTEMIKTLKEQKEAFQQLMDAQDALDAAQQAADEAGDGEGEGEGEGAEGEESEEGGGKPGGKSKEELELEAAKQYMQDALDDFQESMQTKEVKNSLNAGLQRVRDSMKKVSSTIQKWGLGGDSKFSNSGHRAKLELLNKLENSRQLKEIAELAGKLTMLALSAQAQKIPKGCEEVYSLTLGRDFERMLPQELLRMQDPDREIEFFRDYTEGRCLQYALKGKEKKARGAMVVCIDESGSMSGTPDAWAKAVAIALLNVAKKQNRNFFVVHFNGNRNAKSLPVHSFSKTEGYEATKVIEMAEMFMDGGTDFMAPLDRARMCIDEEINFHKADIIFITDGECAVTNDWLKDFKAWKKSKEVTLFSVLVNTGWACSNASLKEFSDRITTLADITSKGEGVAIDIFQAV